MPNESRALGELTGVRAAARSMSPDHEGVVPPSAAEAAGAKPASATSSAPLAAAERLYREHFEFVWRNARRLGCSDDWVDDAVHEIFLVATRRLPEFEGRSSERTWLFSITFRIVQRWQRDRARQRSHLARYVQERPAACSDSEREAQAAEYLRHLLLQLPEAQRALVVMSELEGFTSAEIAESLGVPRGTIDSRLRAAKLALSRAIEHDRKQDERLGT